MPRLVSPLLLATAILSAGGFAVWQVERLEAAISGASARPNRLGRGGSGRTELSVVTPEPASLRPVTTVYGQVTAPNRVDVTPSVSGRITALMDGLRDGARVDAGDLLLRIDDTEARLDLREAQAERASAETTLAERERNIEEARTELTFVQELLALKEADLARTTALIEKGTYSKTLVETSKAALLAARQSVSEHGAALAAAEDLASQGRIALEQASLDVARAEKTVADHRITAPISGIFSGDRPILGQHLSETAIGSIIDMDALEIRLDLTQVAVLRITGPDGEVRPLPVTATRPGVEVSATGVLDRLTFEDGADMADQTIAIARIDGHRAARLRPGDFVEVRITEPALEGLLSLPASAVLPGDEVLAVRNGLLERLPAPVLRRQGETVILASNDLAERKIVLLPSGEMESGMRVSTTAPPGGPADVTARAGIRREPTEGGE